MTESALKADAQQAGHPPAAEIVKNTLETGSSCICQLPYALKGMQSLYFLLKCSDPRHLMLESMERESVPYAAQGLDNQTKTTDEALFESIGPLQIVSHIVPGPKQPPNHATVRIYALSPHRSRLADTPDFAPPSVITVERAALCKVFLETKYHKTFEQPSERESRRQTLHSLVCKGKELNPQQADKFNAILKSVESEWSRLSRVRPSIDAFEIQQRLGAGGFGIVNLVKEKSTGCLYAMKSISKDKTLRLGHEGRVLCERDLLKKASESGSRWICKLHYAFQDMQALHLVLEYMGGGDFLMLLLQKAPLRENETRFYLAEMINGIDACHKLGFMHRDVKPDNFLLTPNGHLKIADFGLATSGEWIYQESYRSSRRKELLRRYHQSIIEDGAEVACDSTGDSPSQDEAIQKVRRMHADSVVGTYYYMAPEILQGEKYNASADWWSLGIILYECLFGFPPFWASTKRATQKIIIDWTNSFEMPLEPRTSDTAKRLIRALISNANDRLRTPTWEVELSAQHGHPISANERMQVFSKDVRNHAFFRNAKVDFESLHLMTPPTVPKGIDTSPVASRKNSAINFNLSDKTIRTKDVMLHDERVLKERRHGAFKNYTYRGPDIGVALQRFSEAIDNTE